MWAGLYGRRRGCETAQFFLNDSCQGIFSDNVCYSANKPELNYLKLEIDESDVEKILIQFEALGFVSVLFKKMNLITLNFIIKLQKKVLLMSFATELRNQARRMKITLTDSLPTNHHKLAEGGVI